MKKITLLGAAGLVLAACGGDPIPGAEKAAAVCAMFCNACGAENPDCSTTCLDQWHVFGGFDDVERRECVDRYLVARECQLDRAPDCGAAACGDPYNDLVRCVERINAGSGEL